MPTSSFMRRPPTGFGFLFLGIVVGTAYGMVLAASWRRATGIGKPRDKSGPQEAVRPRVICFGDSLTQYGFDVDRAGWLALLAHWWERRFDVVNRGFSGYNTRWLLPLAEKLFVRDTAAAAPIELVMIFLGANDCVLPGAAQHVPIEEYKNNLKAMIAHVREVHPESKILLITPPSIHVAKWAKHRALQQRKMDRELKVTMSYASACTEVASEVSVPVVDAFETMGSGDQQLADRYLHDGVHFTAEGNRALFDRVKAVIVRVFPELDPFSGAAMPMQAPYWGDVDPDNPTESVLRDL